MPYLDELDDDQTPFDEDLVTAQNLRDAQEECSRNVASFQGAQPQAESTNT